MAGFTRKVQVAKPLPRAWTIVGLALLSWAGLFALAQAVSRLSQFVFAAL